MRVRPTPSVARLCLASSLTVLVLGTTACGGGPTGQPPPPDSPSSSSPSPSPIPVPEALTFTGTTLDGAPFEAASLAGKPVILWFWAPWCAFCFGQGPAVGDLARRYEGRVAIVGVAGLDQSPDAMREFVTQAEVGNLVQLDDRTGAVWKRFGVTEQSTYAMINRAGEVMNTGWSDTVTLANWVTYLDEH